VVPAVLVDRLRHARDLLGLVADALQVGDDLADSHDQAQVARRGLALDDDVVARAVDRDFVAVHAALVLDHLSDHRGIAAAERVDRGEDLRLDETSHLQHASARAAQVRFELLGYVLAARAHGDS
jgi:hypothetical protein